MIVVQIPQITGIFGTCGGGMAMIPALTDFTLMEEKKAKLFVNSPNAIEGNEISKCDTSAAEYQAKEAGAFGPGVAELMHHVEETGSLSEACRCMGMAYSKGWRIMKHAEEDLGFPLMEGSRGGSRGGRTMLTEKGKDFLHRYEMFMAELNRSAGESFMRWFEA